MHSKDNNKYKIITQGLRPFSSSIPKTLKKYLKKGGYNYSNIVDNWTTMVNKKILFPKEYPYTSSTTKILRENFKELYKECRKLINISKKDLVVDIGSNDGNLLSNFKDHHKVLGITPEKIGKIAVKRGIKTLIRYFDKKTCKLVIRKYGKAKIITATNVFAHIEDVNSLMKNIMSFYLVWKKN